MFKWNPTVYMAIVGLVIGSCSCFATDEDIPIEKMKNYQKYKDILLDSSEVPNVRKEKVNSSSWVIRMGPKGERLEEVGFTQVFEFKNNPGMTIIEYGRFSDRNAAEEALSFFFKTSAEPFQSEPWTDAQLANEPDQIWFNSYGSLSMIVFRYGKTCVTISSHKGSVVEKRKQILYFTDKVIGRLRELQGEAEIPPGDSVVAETNAPTPAQNESSILSEETPPEPVPEPQVPAPSPKSAKRTPRVAPWLLLLLCIGGLAALGRRIAHKKRMANKG